MALEVVTAGGHFITVSADDNTDVYWALRGGSSGSIGVVTSIIIRVHSKGPRHHFSLLIRYLRDRKRRRLLGGCPQILLAFHPLYGRRGLRLVRLAHTNGSYSFTMSPFFAPNHTIDSFNALVRPWFDTHTSLARETPPTTKCTTRPGPLPEEATSASRAPAHPRTREPPALPPQLGGRDQVRRHFRRAPQPERAREEEDGVPPGPAQPGGSG